jgi:hypothetical protein
VPKLVLAAVIATQSLQEGIVRLDLGVRTEARR